MRFTTLLLACLFTGLASATFATQVEVVKEEQSKEVSVEKEVGDRTIKFQYGVGFSDSDIITDDVRSINIGYYIGLNDALSWAATAGYYGDKRVDLDTGYACAQFGASLNPFDWMFVENYFGPCYFHETKGALSGHLQFATNIGAGWRDPSTGSEIGLNWKHFSNAGLNEPNIGADLLMLSLAFGL